MALSYLLLTLYLIVSKLLWLWDTMPLGHHKVSKLLLVIFIIFYHQLLLEVPKKRAMGWPFKKVDFTSNDFIFHLFDAITISIDRMFPLQYVGESVWISPFQHLKKQNCLLKTFFKNSDRDDSGIFLPFFPSRTNLKLHNISVTLRWLKRS